MKWKKLSSKLVYKNKWMQVTEDLIQTRTGEKAKFGIVHKKPFAMIIPWDGKNLTLVGQYRPAIESFSWEFPSGHLEHNSIEETAKEELKEETGLEAKSLKEIAYFNIAGGHHTQVCHIFLATGLEDGKATPEESEAGLRSKKVKLDDFIKMIDKGEIKDGPTIASYGIAVIKNLLK